MSGATPELNLATAVDSDDTADYLTIALANGLITLDSLFNNVSGHAHAAPHQGAPISGASIADGSITSAKIADGTIQTGDLAPHAISRLTGAIGVALSPSTTSTTDVDVPDLALSLTLPNVADLYIAITVAASMATVGGSGWQLFPMVDGVKYLANSGAISQAVAGGVNTLSCGLILLGVAAGAHTISARWVVLNSGTLTGYSTARSLSVVELRR